MVIAASVPAEPAPLEQNKENTVANEVGTSNGSKNQVDALEYYAKNNLQKPDGVRKMPQVRGLIENSQRSATPPSEIKGGMDRKVERRPFEPHREEITLDDSAILELFNSNQLANELSSLTVEGKASGRFSFSQSEIREALSTLGERPIQSVFDSNISKRDLLIQLQARFAEIEAKRQAGGELTEVEQQIKDVVEGGR